MCKILVRGEDCISGGDSVESNGMLDKSYPIPMSPSIPQWQQILTRYSGSSQGAMVKYHEKRSMPAKKKARRIVSQ